MTLWDHVKDFFQAMKDWEENGGLLPTAFPDYTFDKRIFRAALAIVMLIALYGIIDGNVHAEIELFGEEHSISAGYAYAHCPENSGGCQNPYNAKEWNEIAVAQKQSPDNYICESTNLCSHGELRPGETIGERPPVLVQNLGMVALALFLIAFLVNHYVHNQDNDTPILRGDLK